ncbi:hypothetical protein [Streptomyces alkaliterrae]|uniref:Type II secretion system protein GspF domain-containing protein n=1 Tax=Streptomyces alkaliterrae TaxID=2213162 RepID=A0A5P0YKE8_9ACTN|nr:hypothetical protein [Streptomyces alkaliterrae]MBB1258337.1 hypothetical protein [Streptomyces alkaliterrae]MQS00681.1 hypothetical protein [Streptomyces alkaliterrae]
MMLLTLCGCLVGGGLALLLTQFVRPQPALGPALRRTDPAARRLVERELRLDRDEVWGRWLLARIGHLPWVRLPVHHLALLGVSPGRHLLTKVAMALMGLLVPSLATAPWIVLGLGMPLAVPALFGVLLAGLLWWVPDLAVRDRAKRAREEFAHAMAAYLDLVALRRAGDAAPTQALEQAAAVGRGWPMVRLQDALRQARIDKAAPWDALHALSAELQLPAVEDLADIMRRSSEDGAGVYDTLRARARSLSDQLLADQATEANADSEKMTAPGALLAVLLMLLLGFPAVFRILTT